MSLVLQQSESTPQPVSWVVTQPQRPSPVEQRPLQQSLSTAQAERSGVQSMLVAHACDAESQMPEQHSLAAEHVESIALQSVAGPSLPASPLGAIFPPQPTMIATIHGSQRMKAVYARMLRSSQGVRFRA